jgi:hypothetical protein
MLALAKRIRLYPEIFESLLKFFILLSLRSLTLYEIDTSLPSLNVFSRFVNRVVVCRSCITDNIERRERCTVCVDFFFPFSLHFCTPGMLAMCTMYPAGNTLIGAQSTNILVGSCIISTFIHV